MIREMILHVLKEILEFLNIEVNWEYFPYFHLNLVWEICFWKYYISDILLYYININILLYYVNACISVI